MAPTASQSSRASRQLLAHDDLRPFALLPMLKAMRNPVLACALSALASSACDIDGGFSINSTVILNDVGDLSHAPVYVRGYREQDIDTLGRVRLGAQPIYDMRTSGAMTGGLPLSFEYTSLGYPIEALFVVFVDVDGDVSEPRSANANKQPGPGDIVGAPPLTRFVGARGTDGSYADFGAPLVFPHAAIVPGRGPLVVRLIDVSVRFSISDVPGGIVTISAEAYAPGDFEQGRPCAACQPLYTFEDHHELVTGGRQLLSFSSPRAAQPVRVWIRGVVAGDVVLAGSVSEGELWKSENSTRSRAAIGLTAQLTMVE